MTVLEGAFSRGRVVELFRDVSDQTQSPGWKASIWITTEMLKTHQTRAHTCARTGPHQTLPHLIVTQRPRQVQSFVVWEKLRGSYTRISLFHWAEKRCATFSITPIQAALSSSHRVRVPPLPPAPPTRITPPWCARSASLDGPTQPTATALVWRMYCHNLVQNI